ncbi:MAG TPA: PKD domain-containing protein [archaeon]|nr:PKD domain-containing protein [archaeon]
MKRIAALSGFLYILTLSTAQADSLTLEEVTVLPGDTAVVNLILNNSVAVGGFQFVVTPSPTGEVTFSEVEAVSRAAGWSISTNASGDGVMVLGYSASGASLAAGNEAILTFKYLVDQGASEGAVALEITGVQISDDALQAIAGIGIKNGVITIQSLVPANQAPVASFTATPESGEPPLEVDFDASGSSDADGSISTYTWDFGDNTTGSGVTVSHTFDNAGSYTVTLTVTDNEGAAGTLSKTIEVRTAGAFKKGDVNRDGKTNIFDLLSLLAILGGSEQDYY